MLELELETDLDFDTSTFFSDVLLHGITDVARTDPQSDHLLAFSEALLRINPDSDVGFSHRGLYHLVQSNFAMAQADFTAAIDRNEHEYRHHFYRGQLFEAMGDLDHAERDYARALALNPGASDLIERLQNVKEQPADRSGGRDPKS